MSSDCVLLFWRAAGRSYCVAIGVFCLVHRLTFFAPRRYVGVLAIQENRRVENVGKRKIKILPAA